VFTPRDNPLSGASHFRDSGHDIDIYVHGKEAEPFVAEVKARKNGNGFTTLETSHSYEGIEEGSDGKRRAGIGRMYAGPASIA
jgi:hypothetical protein